jgi:hypothetical protein
VLFRIQTGITAKNFFATSQAATHDDCVAVGTARGYKIDGAFKAVKGELCPIDKKNIIFFYIHAAVHASFLYHITLHGFLSGLKAWSVPKMIFN